MVDISLDFQNTLKMILSQPGDIYPSTSSERYINFTSTREAGVDARQWMATSEIINLTGGIWW